MLSIPKTISKIVRVKREIQASGVAKNSMVKSYMANIKKACRFTSTG